MIEEGSSLRADKLTCPNLILYGYKMRSLLLAIFLDGYRLKQSGLLRFENKGIS